MSVQMCNKKMYMVSISFLANLCICMHTRSENNAEWIGSEV